MVKMMTKQEFKEAKVYKQRNKLMVNDEAVMFYSEKNTITERVLELCKKYKPKKVLEIGFGLGYTATAFQKYGIKEHTILEPHPKIFKKAQKWADKYVNNSCAIFLVNEFYQEWKHDPKWFDLILDDRCDLVYKMDGEVTPRYKIRGLAGWGKLSMKPINRKLTK